MTRHTWWRKSESCWEISKLLEGGDGAPPLQEPSVGAGLRARPFSRTAFRTWDSGQRYAVSPSAHDIILKVSPSREFTPIAADGS